MPIALTTGRVWLIGLFGAFLGGGFAAVMDASSLAMFDQGGMVPFSKPWWGKIMFTMITTGGASAKLYLANHPFEKVLSELSLKSTDAAGNVTTIQAKQTEPAKNDADPQS